MMCCCGQGNEPSFSGEVIDNLNEPQKEAVPSGDN